MFVSKAKGDWLNVVLSHVETEVTTLIHVGHVC